MQHDRIANTLRLMKWINANEEDWEKICGNAGTDLPISECVRLINIMRDEEFYEAILFILYNNLLTGIVGELLLEKITQEWTKKDIEAFIELIIEALNREDGKIVSLQDYRELREKHQ